MSFNITPFGRTSFNRVNDNEIELFVQGFEYVDASIGSTLDYRTECIGYERVEVSVDGNPARFISNIKGSEAVTKLALSGQIVVFAVGSGTETVASPSDKIMADYKAEAVGAETVSSDVHMDFDCQLEADLSETVGSTTVIGCDTWITAEGYELVTESASLENIEIKTCNLNLTLRPGQTLIVDSSTLNVLLDNQNAIDVHSGDWIDELNRNTTEIRIDSASGAAGLTATILYTERYL